MDFEKSPRVAELEARLSSFMDEHVYPVEHLYREQVDTADNRWETPPIMHDLKQRAREAGLWNLFIPPKFREHGGEGLSNF